MQRKKVVCQVYKRERKARHEFVKHNVIDFFSCLVLFREVIEIYLLDVLLLHRREGQVHGGVIIAMKPWVLFLVLIPVLLEAVDHELHVFLLFGQADCIKQNFRLLTRQKGTQQRNAVSFEDKAAHKDEVDVFVPETLIIPQYFKHLNVISDQGQHENEGLLSLANELALVGIFSLIFLSLIWKQLFLRPLPLVIVADM